MSIYIVVDVESDGNLIGTNSMVCFGAVHIDSELKLDNCFYGQTAPISTAYNFKALAISGFTREEHKSFDGCHLTMIRFYNWLIQFHKPILISDNNGYDASWINWYMLKYVGQNPFGWSSRRIGDMFCGFMNDEKYQWKKHRDEQKYPHNHHPLSDAKGNASALIYLKEQGFNIKFK